MSRAPSDNVTRRAGSIGPPPASAGGPRGSAPARYSSPGSPDDVAQVSFTMTVPCLQHVIAEHPDLAVSDNHRHQRLRQHLQVLEFLPDDGLPCPTMNSSASALPSISRYRRAPRGPGRRPQEQVRTARRMVLLVTCLVFTTLSRPIMPRMGLKFSWLFFTTTLYCSDGHENPP